MIVDANGVPYPEKPIGQRYLEILERSYRDTKWNLTSAILNGWTTEQYRHWVNTGEAPLRPGVSE